MVAHQLPSTIVGQDAELARLVTCLDVAIRGRGGLVLIGGEAGIGKSTLISRLASEASRRDIPALTGAADDLPTAAPFGPWIDLFRRYRTDDRLPERPEWFDIDPSMDRIDTRGTLFHEIHEFLVAVSDRTPILLMLEDLHRSDTDSLELLRYLNRRINDLPILLIGTYRTEELTTSAPLYHLLPELVREGSVERVQLGRLDDSSTRVLVSDRYDLTAEDGDRLTWYLQEHAEGNPLFITELLRTLESERVIEQRAEACHLGALDRVPVPPLVRQMIDGRLRSLDDRVRWLISIAAMLGKEIPFETWQRVTEADEEELERALDAALEQNILAQFPDGVLTFSHALIREVLLAGIILPRRRNLHRKIAEALIEEGPFVERNPEPVAYHLWAARDDRAPEWLVRAGARANSVYAYEAAEERLSRALELTGDTSEQLRIQALNARGTAREMMGRFDQALEDRQTVLSISKRRGDPREIWQAMIDLGDLWTARDYREVGAYYQQVLDLARKANDSEMLAHSLNRIGNWYTNIDQPRDGLQYHDEALHLFDGAGDEGGIARSLDLQAIAAYLHGDMPASAEYYRHAIRLFREQRDLHGLASSLPTLMLTGGSYDSETVCVAQGADEDWLRMGHEGLELARQTGWRATEAFILSHLGLALGMRGEYQKALDYARQGLDLAMSIDHREWITAGHFAVGIILVDCLNIDEARSHLARARDYALATHSLFWSRASAGALAWAYLVEGNTEAARQAIDHVSDSHSGFDSISLRQCWFRRAELALAESDPNGALEIIDRLIATVPSGQQTEPVPHLEWLRGRTLTELKRYEEAGRALERARTRSEELGYRPLLWSIDLVSGHLLRSTGDRQRATEAFQSAIKTVIELAGQIEDVSIRTTFRDHAIALFPADLNAEPDVQSPFQLSKRERDVLALVARGMTDSEVGEALYISPRTVGRHLQSIYNKLGINSRTAAARLAVEQDLI